MSRTALTITAAAVALAFTLGIAAPAVAQSGSGSSNCATTWSFTRANSTQSLRHTHEYGGFWRSTVLPSGASSWRGIWRPGVVFMTLSTPGNYSFAVFGCSA